MGKGTIKSGGANGLYSVQLNIDRSRVAAAISALNGRVANLTAKIDILPSGIERTVLQLQRTSLSKQLAYLQNTAKVPSDPVVSAYCADLSESLSGEVATIEVPGERIDDQAHIAPGYGTNAAYTAATDGQLQGAMAGTPASTFYNLAMLPGWQRWKPTYRYGTISSIDYDEDTCTVILSAAVSSVLGLTINPADTTLENVPIQYMSCHSSAFVVGDQVIVKFMGQSWDSPMVVGFKAEPKGCSDYVAIIGVYKLTVRDGDFDVAYAWNFTKNALHKAYDSEGNEISQPTTRAALYAALHPAGYVASGIPGYISWTPFTNWPARGVPHFDYTWPDGIDWIALTGHEYWYDPRIYGEPNPLHRDHDYARYGYAAEYDPITETPGDYSAVIVEHRAEYEMEITDGELWTPFYSETLSRQATITGHNMPGSISGSSGDAAPWAYVATEGSPDEKFPVVGTVGCTWNLALLKMLSFGGAYNTETGENVVSKVWQREYSEGAWGAWAEKTIPAEIAVNYIWSIL